VNYRHHYHAGNYADVFKHVLLGPLVAGLQRKEKGFVYLDTHAGRGRYELGPVHLLPDGRERAPEWPAGLGRLWDAPGLPPALADYVALVRDFSARHGGGAAPAWYPGSPWIVRLRLRPQDRAVLCELRPEEAEALAIEFGREPRVDVRATDGYAALRALLPPPEKRALVLIDPPFESATEFADLARALAEGRRRLPGGTFVVWYPLTERARSDRFIADLAGAADAPPMLVAELQVAGDAAQVRMKGCGLLVLNPPWRVDEEFRAVLPALAEHLRADAGGSWRLTWPVPER
jgi:23S rRNA (adenine2030-N6)-methyltransferase